MRVMIQVSSFPLLLLLIAEKPPHEQDDRRREVASLLLRTNLCCLVFQNSDLAIKLRYMYKKDFEELAATGVCSIRLHAAVVMMRAKLRGAL